MQRRIIIIIFFNFWCFLGFTQDLTISDCDFSSNFASNVAVAQSGDNYVEVNFSDVSVRKEADGYFYLFFTINLKAIGTWYAAAGNKISAKNKYLGALDIYLDFNQDVFGSVVAEISPIENIEYNYNAEDDVSWKTAYVGDNETIIAKPAPDLLMGCLGYSDTGDGSSFPLTTSDYLYVGKFRWRMKAGVTGGRTGVALRIPTITGYEGDGTYPSKAFDYKTMVPLGMCQTGPSLDIEFGEGGAAPTITDITGDLIACEGSTATYTAKVEDGATLNWIVKKDGVGDVTSTVVDGTMNATGKTVSFKWKNNAVGTYSICATASKGGKVSDEKCEPIEVKAAPALALTSTPDATGGLCAGADITLNATAGLTDYKWYKDGTVQTAATANSYTTKLPTTGTQVTYKVEAKATPANGSCPASKELSVTISPQPLADATVKVGNNSAVSTDNKYYFGDHIVLTAKDVDETKYEYSWEDASGNVLANGPVYDIASATAANYKLYLKVKGKTSPFCTATKEINLTKDGNCNQTLALSGSDNNRICLPHGICRLTAKLTNGCSTVTDYVWYKDGVKLDSVSVTDGATEKVFNVFQEGNYSVKIYTYRGTLTQNVTITKRSQAAATIIMPDTYLVTNGGTTLLTPNPSIPVLTWVWEPNDLIATGAGTQYPTTGQLYNDAQFFVYAQDQNSCWLMDSTWVKISNDALTVKIEPENPTICQAGSVTLHSKVTGGDGNYTYSWSTDQYDGSAYTDADYLFKDNALYATGTTRWVDKILTVTDGAGHTGVAKTVVQIVTTPTPNLGISGGGIICEGDALKVTGGSGVSGYVWYIRDNSNGSVAQRNVASSTDTIRFGTRGDYYVWVSGKTTNCASDTSSKGVGVKVNGFDLAFTTPPVDYMLGATINAEVTASNGAAPYSFNWTSPAEGTAQTGNTVNPNKFQLAGASASQYTFKVTATDGNSCKKTVEKTVNNTITGGLKVTVPNEVLFCNQGSAVMPATAQGGTAPYKFTWYKAGAEGTSLKEKQGAAGETTDTYISTVNYTVDTKIVVKVSDAAGLISRDTVTIKVRTDLTAPKIDAGDPMTIAYNTQTYLMGTVISGTPVSWTWADDAKLVSGKNTANPYTVALTGQTTYTAYVTDANQCTSPSDQVTINVTDDHNYKLAVDIDPVALLCKGSKVTLNAAVTPQDRDITGWNWGSTLSASDADLVSATGKNPTFEIKNVSGSSADIYVRVTDNANVSATDKITVNLQNAQAPVLAITGYKVKDGNNEICSLEELKVSSINGVTLGTCTWYVAGVEKQKGNSTVYKPVVSGNNEEFQNIKVSALSSAGCPATGSENIGVSVYPKPVLAWEAATESQVKPGFPVTVQAKLNPGTTGQYTYTWSHTGTNASVSFNDEGTTAGNLTEVKSTASVNADAATQPYYFSVKVTDGNGCESLGIDSVITVDGAALSVDLKSAYGDYCQGGVAVLRAKVAGVDDANVNFEWYKNGVLISGQSEHELVVLNPNTTDIYKVKATLKSDATRTGDSPDLTLTEKAGATAPVIAGVDMKIPTNTMTALVVNTTDNIQSWKWSPEAKLQAGESTLRSPYTQVLSQTTTYTVYGVDANGCVGADDDVKVSVIGGLTPGGDEDPDLFVKVIPQKDTICIGNELDVCTEVWSSVGGTPTYTWEPATNLTLNANQSGGVFGPVTDAGDYSYTVLVKVNNMVAAARTDIVVVPGVIPNLVVDANTGAHCAGNDLILTANNLAAGVGLTYTWTVNGDVKPVTGNTYTWPSSTMEATYNVKVTAKSSDHCLSTTYEDDFTIQPAVELQKLQVVDSCGQVILVADAGVGATYTWSVKSGSVQASANKDTCRVVYQGILSASSATYTVNVEATPQNGGCKATKDVTGKLYFKPRAEFADWVPAGETNGLPYMVVEKGNNATVSLNQANWNLTSAMAAVNINWAAEHATNLTPSANKASCTVNSVQQDDSVYVKIANKEAEKCMVTDTMPLYLYPQAPSIDIDTNTCLTDIKITWPAAMADSVQVWSIKEDGYNVTGIGYKHIASVEMAKLKWVEPNMANRLMFYYIRSVKHIQGRSFVSNPSDTVGWLKQTLLAVNASGKGTQNIIAYPFDMTAKGVVTNRDLFLKRIDNNLRPDGGMIGYWNYANQSWGNELILDMGMGLEGIDVPFNLEPGGTYNLTFEGATSTTTSELLLYGKLLKPFTYNFTLNAAPKGSETFVLYPLSLVNRKALQPLGDVLGCDYLGSYEFSGQMYNNITGFDMGTGTITWFPGETEAGSPSINPWTPVRFTLLKNLSNWSK